MINRDEVDVYNKDVDGIQSQLIVTVTTTLPSVTFGFPVVSDVSLSGHKSHSRMISRVRNQSGQTDKSIWGMSWHQEA